MLFPLQPVSSGEVTAPGQGAQGRGHSWALQGTHGAGAAAVAVDLEPSTEDFTPAEPWAWGHGPEGHRPHSHRVGLPEEQGQQASLSP